MDCLSEEQLELLARDDPAARETAVHQHLEACSFCRDRLQERTDNEICLHHLRELIVEPDERATNASSPELLERYEMIAEVHQGAQGIVYRALQKSTGRQVAIKVMKDGPFANRLERARFDREVRILAALKHPNIVAIHDSGLTRGHFFFVMDYIAGQPLDVWMTVARYSPREMLTLFAKVCDAVNAAHLRGIIHRDLKPANIRVDASGEPHILDFGVAKTTGDDLRGGASRFMTITGQFIGSLPWASPEQAEGVPEQVDLRSDVYSLGVILYHMLTGRFPYEVTGTIRQVLERISTAEPIRPSSLQPCIDREIETIVLKCLSREPGRRYQTASELARDLRHYLAGEPIEALPHSVGYILRKLWRRYRLRMSFAIAMVVVVLVALVASLTFWKHALSERDRAQAAERASEVHLKQAVNNLRLAEQLSTEARLARDAERMQRDLADSRAAEADAAQRLAEQERDRTYASTLALKRSFYAQQILLADAAYRSGHASRVRELLAECAPEMRGWEWYRLNWLMDRSDSTLKLPTDLVSVTAFSTDGSEIACAEGTSVYICSTSNGQPRLQLEHGKPVTALAFSPDGTRLASGGRSGAIRIWDRGSGQCQQILLGHEGAIATLSFNRHGNHLVSVTAGNGWGTLRVWDLSTGSGFLPIENRPASISTAEFGLDGTQLLIARTGGQVQMLGLQPGARNDLVQELGVVLDATWSPDGRQLALGLTTGVVSIWRADLSERLFELEGHPGAVTQLAWASGGAVLSSADETGTIKTWETATGTLVSTLYGHRQKLTSLCALPDDGYLMSASADGTLKRWDLSIRGDFIALDRSNEVWDLAISPRGHTIVIGGPNGSTFYEPSSRATCQVNHQAVYKVAFSPDGTRFVTGGGGIHVWDTASRALLHSSPECAANVTFGPDGMEFLWRGFRMVRDFTRNERRFEATAFSPDGQRFARSACHSYRHNGQRTICIQSAESETDLLTLFDVGQVTAISFSPDGSRLIAGNQEGEVRVWDAHKGEAQLRLCGHSNGVNAVAMSPDGRRILSGGADQTVKLWNTDHGHELLTLTGHSGAIRAVGFTVDGSTVISGGDDGLLVWRTSDQPALNRP